MDDLFEMRSNYSANTMHFELFVYNYVVCNVLQFHLPFMWPNCKTFFCSLHYILSLYIGHVQIFRRDFLIQRATTKIRVCDPLRRIEIKYFEACNFCKSFFLCFLSEVRPSNETADLC